MLLCCVFYRLIPKQGNKAEIILTALHHNMLGMDEFLGRINIPLAEMDVYERPKNRYIYFTFRLYFKSLGFFR